MAKTTIYLNKEAEKIYEKAKEFAGDNLSAVIVQSLKLYVEKMESQAQGMEEQIIFVGSHYYHEDIYQGKNLKFIGTILGRGGNDRGQGETHFVLYLTRKGKFLVHCIKDNIQVGEQVFSYKPYNSFNEVMEAGYPATMLDAARKAMKEVTCEELDV